MLNKELLMVGSESLEPVLSIYISPDLRYSPAVSGRLSSGESFYVSNAGENNKVDIDVAKGFINSAFDKSGTVEYLGFKFDKSDGEALINIMEKYKDD